LPHEASVSPPVNPLLFGTGLINNRLIGIMFKNKRLSIEKRAHKTKTLKIFAFFIGFIASAISAAVGR